MVDYELDDIGVNNLIYAIVMSAVRDYYDTDDRIKLSAIKFFYSDYFALLTKGKIDPIAVLEKLDKTSKVSYYANGDNFTKNRR